MAELITLDAVPIKYGYHTPSMSRRGGVRLHPINDGVIRHSYERGVTHRDFMGNKLRDTINPQTGFCNGVISPVLGGRVGQGTSGSPTVESARGYVTKRDGHYFDGLTGTHLRTLDMGDEPLPSAPRSNDTAPTKKPRSVAPSGSKRAVSDMSRVPGATGRDGRITKADVVAYLKAMAKGRPFAVTPQALKLGRAALEAKRADAARALKIK